jgi:hypothetical protein
MESAACEEVDWIQLVGDREHGDVLGFHKKR